MSTNTPIEWTDHTFNPWWGCAKVSPGCDHCYAETWAKRFGVKWGVDEPRREFGDKHWNEPLKWDRAAKASGKRAYVFCASMADVFDKNAPDGARERLWRLIASTPNLDWQLLTKRIGNAPNMLPVDWGDGWAHVWLGATVVNQEEADRDIPKLLATPARTRFLSCEPLLGPVQLTRLPFRDGDERHRQDALTGEAHLYCTGINGNPDMTVKTEPVMPRLRWVISGGESGSKARPSHPDWFRSLRDQCHAAGVAYFFKQWGEWATTNISAFTQTEHDRGRACILDIHGNRHTGQGLGHAVMARIGKKAAGCLLDGREHNEYPV